MSLNTEVKFQNKISVSWSRSSQGSQGFVYLHTNTRTHTHVFVLLKVIFGSCISFNLHMKHYFTKLFTSMDFRHHFSLTCSKFLPCKLRRRHTSIPDFNSQAEVSYQRNWEKRKREIVMLLIEERRQTLI